MTKSGAPAVCYHPAIGGWEPYPFWTRMIADGMEAILDGWLYLHKKGTEEDAWLAFCKKTADWYVRIQNEDGSYYRSYKADGSVNMDSKANTPSPIRFLIQMYLVTGDASYRQAAVRAGAWAYENQHQKMEYRGGTCDNLDVTDKEAGIYALFGFLALYDLTADRSGWRPRCQRRITRKPGPMRGHFRWWLRSRYTPSTTIRSADRAS